MVYIEIPDFPENKRLNKDLVKKGIDILSISENAKQNAFAAIYNFQPRGVEFDEKDAEDAGKLEAALQKLGVPFRRSEESEY